MSYYKFEEDDLFINTIEAYPQYRFYVQSGSIYINSTPHLSGANTDHITGVPKGFISLYEYNIDRPSGNDIYPFIEKDGHRVSLKTRTKTSYNPSLLFGETDAGSYNMSTFNVFKYFSQLIQLFDENLSVTVYIYKPLDINHDSRCFFIFRD